MYVIAGIVAVIYAVLGLVSRKENIAADEKISALMRPFYKMAAFIYRKACEKNQAPVSRADVSKDLKMLHPGADVKELCSSYYIKKTALALMICLVGTAVCVIISINTYNSRLLEAGGSVRRSSFGQDALSVRLKTAKNNEDVFVIDVEPTVPTDEELEKKYTEYLKLLEKTMLDENASAENVTADLNLTDYVDGYPFYSEWQSSRPDIVSSMGTVYSVEEPEEVILTATVTYEDKEWTNEFVIKVVPEFISDDEAYTMDMQSLLETSEAQSRHNDTWNLPTEYNGEAVEWYEDLTDNSMLIWILVIFVAVAVFVMTDKDLHSDMEKRVQAIRRDYPDIVQKFVLYMGAGMTIRGAFNRIAMDYEEGETDSRLSHPAYEEMLYTCRELQAGVSESAAYEHFGRRTGAQEYVRLCTLLQQNLKKGNAAMLDRLKEEADRASAERLHNGRKLGEEASTKLLVPMVLMLLVIMIIIIIPAFSSTSI
jgi:hypothetical protein